MTTPSRPSTPAVVAGYAGGLLLAVVPTLVELVVGDAIVLLPVGLLLALVSAWTLRGTGAHRLFVGVLVLAIVAELGEQLVFPDDVPTWADVLPPVLFTLAGIALLLAVRSASRPAVEGDLAVG